MNIIFFGSTSDSLIVLRALSESRITSAKGGSASGRNHELRILAVVTQPPRPIGRQQILTPTPVETWAKKNSIPVLSFPTHDTNPVLYADEEAVINTLQTFKADLLVSASYGEKIPSPTIADAPHGGLNVHPSILPRWRGADPVPWAIMTDHQTGVTVVTLSEKMDEGKIIAQKKIPITPDDTTAPLRAKLFTIGAQLLIESLPDYLSGKNKGTPQGTADTPFVRRLTRDDGFEKWESILDPNESQRIERKFRAFHPWPGVWTTIQLPNPTNTTNLPAGEAGPTNEKRLKILSLHLSPVPGTLQIDTVQLEGKNPISWEQFKKAYML